MSSVSNAISSVLLAYLAACVPLSAQNTSSYEFSTATGENGTALPIKETVLLLSELPRQATSTSITAPSGVQISRKGDYRVDRRSSDLRQGLSLLATAETSLSLADAATVPGYTFNYQRPYSKTELKIINEKIYLDNASGNSVSTVRLTGFLDSNVSGIFPAPRTWRNSGNTILSIVASVRKRSNDQIYSTQSGTFRIDHALNNTSTLVSNSVITVLGGSNGAWNANANNGTGFLDVSVPSDAYVLAQVTLSTLVEITDFASSAGNALSSFRSQATAYVDASVVSGSILSTELGLSRLRQYFPLKSYPGLSIGSGPLTLNEIPNSGLTPDYELISGPGSISGNVLTLDGTRGSIVFKVSQPGDDTWAPSSATIRGFDIFGNDQTITFPPQGSRPANHVPFSPDATSNSGLPIVYQILSGPATTDGRLITPTGSVGNISIRATQPGNDTFNPALPVDASIFFEAAIPATTAQTISFPQLLDANLGEGQLLSATASSGLPVTFVIVEGSGKIGGINQNILIATGPGLIRVRATQVGGVFGSTSYLPAVAVERSMSATSLFLQALASGGVPLDKQGASDDADSDGFSNLIEFALGVDLMNSSARPAISFTRTLSGLLSLEYKRVRGDVTYEVQVTSNFTDWTAEGVNQGTPDAEGNVTATAPSAGDARFLRLSVRYP